MTFKNCAFHDLDGFSYYEASIRSRDPITQTAVTIYQSNASFTGTSRFYNNHHSALVCYSSVITLMGSVSFINNTSIRGGALTLYSSILNLEAGVNVTFINNSAQEIGGAIYTEPDLTRMLKLECFYKTKYQLKDCDATSNLYFANNSAENGGDNLYGTSLGYCQRSDDKHCITTTILDIRKSSVSSDPLHVCVCDSEGQPQCTHVSFINMSKNVYPGETFMLSAAIVGLDYGMTIGTVHANFLPSDESNYDSRAASESVPILNPNHQYSQWINNISCTKLTYSIYTDQVQHTFIMYLTVQYTNDPRLLDSQNYWKYCNILQLPHSSAECRHSPIFINVTILPCPSGFTLLKSPSRLGLK